MKRDGKLTDVQLKLQQSDRQENKNWKSMGVKPLILLIIVLGLVSCAPSKPTSTPSVEVTPSPTPTPSVKPLSSPKPKPSAAAPRSETDASQSAGSDRDQTSGGEAQPDYTSKNKAIRPAEKPQPTVIKPAPAIEPDIAPEPRMQDSIPPVQTTPTQMAPIAPQPDSDPEPPPAR